MQSKHAPGRWKDKKRVLLITRIQEALDLYEAEHKDSPVSTEFHRRIAELSRLSSLLEKFSDGDAKSAKCQHIIVSLLRKYRELYGLHGKELKSTLDKIRVSPSWDQKKGLALATALKKLTLYVESAKGLLRAAKKYQYFRKINIKQCQPPDASRIQNYGPRQSGGVWNRYKKSTLDRKDALAIRKYELRTGSRKIEKEVRQSISRKKCLHAEIQLIMYYEQDGNQSKWPRVICATKNACFLCNLFIEYHDSFYSPGSQPAIYETWAIPNVAVSQIAKVRQNHIRQILDQVNVTVERYILRNLTSAIPAPLNANESLVCMAPTLFTPSQMSLKHISHDNDPKPRADDVRVDSAHSKAETPFQAEATEIKAPQVLELPSATLVNEPPCVDATTSIPSEKMLTESAYKADESASYSESRKSGMWKEVSWNQRDSLTVKEVAISPDTSRVNIVTPIPPPKVDEPTPKKASETPKYAHATSGPVQLTRGSPIEYLFTAEANLRIHTPKIHTEISRDKLGIDGGPDASSIHTLHIRIEWLTTDALKTISLADAVSLNDNWKEKTASDGVALKHPGLLLSKGTHTVSICVVRTVE